jgi:hypothetical protein
VCPLCRSLFRGFQLRLSFCIFKLRSDRSLHFVEAVLTLDDAKARVQALGELWPGKYVIHNEATGERISIMVGGTTN